MLEGRGERERAIIVSNRVDVPTKDIFWLRLYGTVDFFHKWPQRLQQYIDILKQIGVVSIRYLT